MEAATLHAPRGSDRAHHVGCQEQGGDPREQADDEQQPTDELHAPTTYTAASGTGTP